MPSLRFTNHRLITSIDQLDDALRDQLAAAGARYDGVEAPAADRIAPEGFEDEGEEGGPLYEPEVWDVVDEDGRARYNAWFYNADSGTIFAAGTAEVVAEIIQFGLEDLRPELQLAQQLHDAKLRAGAAAKGTALGGISFL